MSKHVTQEVEEWQITRRITQTRQAPNQAGIVAPYQIEHTINGLGATFQEAVDDFNRNQNNENTLSFAMRGNRRERSN